MITPSLLKDGVLYDWQPKTAAAMFTLLTIFTHSARLKGLLRLLWP